MKLTAPKPITEAAFQSQILQAAKTFGWLRYHTRYSIGSRPGYPDLTFVRNGRVLFIELKKQTGKISPEQDVWLAALRDCPGVETYLWRPSDLDDAVEILRKTK